MIPDKMEFLGRERWKTLLQEAEHYRLLKRAAAQPADQAMSTWRIRCWLGTELVAWGFQLQGYHLATLPQLPGCEPCNS